MDATIIARNQQLRWDEVDVLQVFRSQGEMIYKLLLNKCIIAPLYQIGNLDKK